MCVWRNTLMCLFMGFHSSAGCDFIIICLLCAACLHPNKPPAHTRVSCYAWILYFFFSFLCASPFFRFVHVLFLFLVAFLQFIYRQLVQQLVLDILCAIETAENNIYKKLILWRFSGPHFSYKVVDMSYLQWNNLEDDEFQEASRKERS